MEDYNNAEGDPVSSTTTIYAPDHKTSLSGPAPISMFKDPDDALFLTESGRQFEKGTIGRRIPEFWATAKVRSDIQITATRMRKMAATTTVYNTDQDKRLIHQHTPHTKTAERPYIRPDAATIAAAGHAMLKSNIGYCKSDDSNVEGTNKTLSEEDHALLEEFFYLEISSNKPLVSKEVANSRLLQNIWKPPSVYLKQENDKRKNCLLSMNFQPSWRIVKHTIIMANCCQFA